VAELILKRTGAVAEERSSTARRTALSSVTAMRMRSVAPRTKV
jgi:hypothetical protein